MKQADILLPIVEQQENTLLYDRFDCAAALALGTKIIALAKARYEKGIALRIDYDGATVFLHHMDGATLNNDWWMQKKLNASRQTGMSSLRSRFVFELGLREKEDWCDNEGNYGLAGGCFPIRLKDKCIVGHAMVSALHQDEDHQLIVDAMAEILGLSVPSVL